MGHVHHTASPGFIEEEVRGGGDCKSQISGKTRAKPYLLDVTGTLYSWNTQQLWVPGQNHASQYSNTGQGVLTADGFWGRERWILCVSMFQGTLTAPYPAGDGQYKVNLMGY